MQCRQTGRQWARDWSTLAAVPGSRSFAIPAEAGCAHGLKASPLTTIQSF